MYAELHCLSNFSFQRGASFPQELVRQAHALGYRALALTDECSLAGIVRAWEAAREIGLPLIVGAEIALAPEPAPAPAQAASLVLLAPTVAAYAQLCALITQGRRRGAKGAYRLALADLECNTGELLALWLPRWPAQGLQEAALAAQIERLREAFAGRLWLAWERHLHPQDRQRLALLERLGTRYGLPRLAAGDVHYHLRERQALHDVMACIRAGCRLQDAGAPVFANAERHLRPLAALERIYPAELLRETLAVAERCSFRLDQLRYEYPHELVPAELAPIEHLRRLTEAGITRRYPAGCPDAVRAQIEKELGLIAELGYEHYFLTVEDLVRYARSQQILCQGRGSAANSAVCYVLGITEVDPGRLNLLFERFISRERAEPPDIDIDFEHQRREEVIQYVYRKYGRGRAALAATVISYRKKSAIRDVGKALGLSLEQVDALSRSLAWWDDQARLAQRLAALGLAPDGELARNLIRLVAEIEGMPRHLSQHVGGFVISHHPLHTLVPVENAAMPERTIIQWDKEDLETMGLLKVDCLALGMLSALRRTVDLVGQYRGRPLALADIPAEDPATYDMICRGQTIGVFQIESRAQMSMLPRLKPRNFFDLVIEVAIVRPGPIQGDMVHPYLRRRCGEETVVYPSKELEAVLGPTLGVPLFQEQVMNIAIVAAGFSPGEADQVRRSMAAWSRKGGLEKFRDKLLAGMRQRHYDPAFAEQIYQQVLGFGSYGFPMSHSASFAMLTYLSCWLKCHQPAAFCAGLLNSQPMGFYAPAQLVNDARRAGVRFRPVDVGVSQWDCTLEQDANDEPGKAPSPCGRGLGEGPLHAPPSPDQHRDQQPAVRLGLNRVAGLSQADAGRIVAARGAAPFESVDALASRAGLNRRALDALALAGALQPLAGHRHAAHWAAAGVQRLDAVLENARLDEPRIALPAPSEGQALAADYRALGLTLGRHPLALLRQRLQRIRVVTAAELGAIENGRSVRVAGIVTHRQRPGTASGVVFVTLEDETGSSNLIIWPRVLERQREAVLGSSLMVVRGQLQSEQGVIHVVARKVEDYSPWLGSLETGSRDFH
jgi:error-prone DNA polymerase